MRYPDSGGWKQGSLRFPLSYLQAGTGEVYFDCGGDVEGKGQDGAALFAGHYGSGAGANGVEKRLDFEAEGLAGCHG